MSLMSARESVCIGGSVPIPPGRNGAVTDTNILGSRLRAQRSLTLDNWTKLIEILERRVMKMYFSPCFQSLMKSDLIVNLKKFNVGLN